MGKKRKAPGPQLEDLLQRPWCYYCERDFDDLSYLIDHQKAKHFHCDRCVRRLNTAGGLGVHKSQVHKEQLERVSNSLPNREDPSIEIFGMEGIPDDILSAHHQRLMTTYFKMESERRALTGNPLAGSKQALQQGSKKQKLETKEEMKERLKAFKAKKKAAKEAGSSSEGNTPGVNVNVNQTETAVSCLHLMRSCIPLAHTDQLKTSRTPELSPRSPVPMPRSSQFDEQSDYTMGGYDPYFRTNSPTAAPESNSPEFEQRPLQHPGSTGTQVTSSRAVDSSKTNNPSGLPPMIHHSSSSPPPRTSLPFVPSLPRRPSFSIGEVPEVTFRWLEKGNRHFLPPKPAFPQGDPLQYTQGNGVHHPQFAPHVMPNVSPTIKEEVKDEVQDRIDALISRGTDTAWTAVPVDGGGYAWRAVSPYQGPPMLSSDNPSLHESFGNAPINPESQTAREECYYQNAWWVPVDMSTPQSTADPSNTVPIKVEQDARTPRSVRRKQDWTAGPSNMTPITQEPVNMSTPQSTADPSNTAPIKIEPDADPECTAPSSSKLAAAATPVKTSKKERKNKEADITKLMYSDNIITPEEKLAMVGRHRYFIDLGR